MRVQEVRPGSGRHMKAHITSLQCPGGNSVWGAICVTGDSDGDGVEDCVDNWYAQYSAAALIGSVLVTPIPTKKIPTRMAVVTPVLSSIMFHQQLHCLAELFFHKKIQSCAIKGAMRVR